MGVIMEKKAKIFNWIGVLCIFIITPSLFYLLGDFPRRTLLKEALSVTTLLSFFIMILMFYLSRINAGTLKPIKMSTAIKWHKVLGYTFVAILITHPFLVVLPRFFESGVSPQDAFCEILLNFDKQSLLFGLIAWITMIVIAITSFFRDNLPMTYKTWRVLHGMLSLVFISFASFHVIQTGRHMNTAFICLVIILSGLGIAMLVRKYIMDSIKEKS